MKQISDTAPPRTLLLTGLCLGIALGASRLPESVAGSVRSTLLDSILPFQMLRESATECWTAWAEQRADRYVSQIEELHRELEASKRIVRLQQIEQAERRELSEREAAIGISRYSPSDAPSLFVSELIRADVIGPRERELFERSLLIERTSGQILEAGSLVLNDDSGVVVDQGADSGLENEHPVYAGRCVVGRLVDVGRWVSRVQLTADKNYRGRAQILRTVEGGFSYGPEGILEGTGAGNCILRYVGRTDSVRVGDGVYTSARSAALPEPMFYGTIVKAELDETDREWTIEIEPAIKPELLRSVQVLRQSINPVRVLGN